MTGLEVFLGAWKSVDGVIWRHQFDQDVSRETALLQMIDYSGVPSINAAQSVLAYGGRLAGMVALKRGGLEIQEQIIAVGSDALSYTVPKFPAVLKVGNAHMGYGKALVKDEESWRDLADVAMLSDDFCCIEPFVPYRRDVRILSFMGTIYAIDRVPSGWKANVQPVAVHRIEPPHELVELGHSALAILGVDIVGLDFLQANDGRWILLEANLSPGLDIPGLSLRGPLLAEMTRRIRELAKGNPGSMLIQ
jgi:ribosomal protein S6--L-glutamate ligase